MAQEQGSFLYRLKLMLDGDEAVQSLGLKMENVKKQVREMGTATGQANGKVEQLVNSFEQAPRALQPLTREVNEADQSLEEMAASATRSWGRVEQGALEAADGAQRLSQSIVRGAERAEGSLKSLAAQQTRVRGTTFSLGSSASSAASQLSVDLTQSAQDAAFGLENLAASAPFLQEQFGRVKRQAGSFTGALADIGSALMGPTGVIAAFTLLLTFKDEIISFFGDITDKLTESSTKFEEFQDTIENTFEKARKEAKETRAQEFANFVQQLTPDDESTDILEGRLETVEGLLEDFNEKREEILQDMQQSRQETLEQAREDVTEDADITTSEEEFLSAEAADSRQTPSETSVTAGVRQTPSARAAEQAREQLGLTSDRIAELKRQKKDLQEVTAEVGFESMEEARVRERLSERYGIEGEKLDKLVQAYMDYREEQEKANDEAETTLELQRRLQEARVEAMEEGISKQINSINLAIQARRQEIQAIEAKTEKQKEQKNTLLDLLDQVAARKREAALEEFSTVDLELQEGEEITAAMDRINSKIDQRISKIQNLEGKYAKLNETQRQQAIEELEQERDEEISDVRSQALLINGRLVRRDEFIENTKENYKMAQQRIQSELEALRFEQESGVRVGSMFGENNLFGGLQNTQDQLGNLEQRFEARRELIREEQEKAARLLMATGDDKYAQVWADLEKKRTRLTKQEAEKRLQITLQNMRQIGNAVESSPIGDATRNLILDLGAMWQSYSEDQIKWQEKTTSEKAAMITQVGSQVVGAASTIAEQTFQSWKSERAQDLKDEGKSAKQRRKILKEEGKKRFRVMKAMKITEASVNTAAGVTRALAELPPPASYAAAAATAAAGLFRIKQIAGMSIGDRIGGGGQGGGARGGQFTQRAAASSATAAGRVGTAMEAQRKNDEDTINRTAKKVGEEVGKQMPDRVTMDDDTAEQANNAAVNQKNKLNK